MDTLDVIEQGKLCMAKSYGVEINMKGLKKSGEDYDTRQYYEENKTYEGVLENYEKYSKGLKTILFASNIASSKQVCGHFISKGYNARHIDGATPKNERQEILQWFAITKDAILCNCGVLTAGFDQPDIMSVILYRATTSLPLFLQMCGRGSRIYPGKTHFNILDFGNNIQRLGFWQDRRIWALKYEKKKQQDAAPIKICPSCNYMMPLSIMVCPSCNFVFEKKEKDEPEKVILKELEWLRGKDRSISELSINDLIRLQKIKKLSTHFVWRVIRSRGVNVLKIYANQMNYSSKWVVYQEGLMFDSDYKDFKLQL
jgi:superfamily II DNA or RNA helicase